jgi:DNA-binding transcriptional ArsR family regulator
MPPIAVLVALADPTRCRIIEILHQGPQPVHTLASSFDISRPAISRHLRVLKEAKLISEKKAGRENRYALHATRLKPVRDWLDVVQATAAKPEPKRVAVKVDRDAAKPVAAPVVPQPPAPQPAPKATSQMGFDF